MGRGVTEEQRAKQKHVGMVFRLLPSILPLEVEKDSNNDAFKHIYSSLEKNLKVRSNSFINKQNSRIEMSRARSIGCQYFDNAQASDTQ